MTFEQFNARMRGAGGGTPFGHGLAIVEYGARQAAALQGPVEVVGAVGKKIKGHTNGMGRTHQLKNSE
jgi:hypothetical protein